MASHDPRRILQKPTESAGSMFFFNDTPGIGPRDALQRHDPDDESCRKLESPIRGGCFCFSRCLNIFAFRKQNALRFDDRAVASIVGESAALHGVRAIATVMLPPYLRQQASRPGP